MKDIVFPLNSSPEPRAVFCVCVFNRHRGPPTYTLTLLGARPGGSQTDKPRVAAAAPPKGSGSRSRALHRGSPGTVVRLESITVFEECFPGHVMLFNCLSAGLGGRRGLRPGGSCSGATGAPACPARALPAADCGCQRSETFATQL